MREQPPVEHPIYCLRARDVAGFDSLAEPALDLRRSWNHATDELWRELDPERWEQTHRPWVVLQTAMKRLRALTGTPGASVSGAAVPAARSAASDTPRLLPDHEGVALPHEDTRILWER